jgi:hypothetical protein
MGTRQVPSVVKSLALHLYVYPGIFLSIVVILGGSMRKKSMGVALALGLASCASPDVVQVEQVGDEAMSCLQLQAAITDAGRFEQEARHERGVTGTNVAAAVLFWPALVGTYMNTDEAIDAARDRQRRLTGIHRQKGC